MVIIISKRGYLILALIVYTSFFLMLLHFILYFQIKLGGKVEMKDENGDEIFCFVVPVDLRMH